MPTIQQLYFSFPVRLLMLHVRNHLVLIFLWIFLALLMTGVAGRFFGIHFLLLTPEYLGRVGFGSFFLLGIGFGALFMVWNLTTYLLCSNRFPFLATLAAPFTKFCLNNSGIPLAFLVIWLVASIRFQWVEELWPMAMIAWNLAGFFSGMATLILILAGWFQLTNKDIGDFLQNPRSVFLNPKFLKTSRRLPGIHEIRSGQFAWRCDTYLNEKLRPRLVRSVAHYDRQILSAVFNQNHFNAVMVQVVAMLLLMILGLFMDDPRCQIPTGASVFILASMGMALFGALSFWFEKWGTLVFIGLLVSINFLTSFGWFNVWNRAYGLDYQPVSRARYDYESLEKLCPPDTVAADRALMEGILNRWLVKNSGSKLPVSDSSKGVEKPKIVFVCVSGGGLRAAAWATHILQKTDLETGGELFQKTILISGASGGMLGATYLRELHLRRQNGEKLDPNDPVFLEKISRDLLNPISFAIVSNDLFVPVRSFRWGNFEYKKDRGYLFEQQIHANTDRFLEKKLADYRLPEARAEVPLVFLTPFILNDGRRLVISPQPVSWMMRPPSNSLKTNELEIESVDFGRLFSRQNGDDLSFASALRMNCTYPYILPNAHLPTVPVVEVMDAGFRDNFGVLSATRFIHTFKNWIQANTSGIVLVEIRCWPKVNDIPGSDSRGWLTGLLQPAIVTALMTDMQDFAQDEMVASLTDLMGETPVERVLFSYKPLRKSSEVSMNLHLSQRELNDLLGELQSVENQVSMGRLKTILNGKNGF